MKILVTGGAGFIGSHAAEYFGLKGHEVAVLDNLSRAALLKKDNSQALYNWNYLGNNYPKLKLIRGDVRKAQDVKAAANGADVILHAAGQVAVTTSVVDPRTDFETNALGGFNVLEAARENDATFVYTSTNKVYGENVNNVPVFEKETRYEFLDCRYGNGLPEEFPTDLAGHSPYGCSKFITDLYAQDYADTYGLRTGVFRMSCIYGERQFGVEDQGWVAWFVIAALTGKPITIYGDGKQVRDVLHVSDLIQVFDKFLNSKLKHEVFNIGGGRTNTLSLIELLDLIQTLTNNKPNRNYAKWRPADQKVYISDISKAQRFLDWIPEVSPDKGVKGLTQWILKNRNMFS